MTETTLLLTGMPRSAAYDELVPQVASVLSSCGGDVVAEMASVACLVHHAFGNLWTGFYRVVGPSLLRVGPYQGTLGCIDIPFERGVCGACARTRRTIVVDDVHAFAGHIACDGRSASEIVVPVFAPDGDLIAVFDVDSEHKAAFTNDDADGLARVVALLGRH
jgi:L-methionine (R)-S-oxide reductase